MICMAKIKISETVIIKRSQINFAPYNPRKEDKNIVKKIAENFRKVGYLGGIQWNPITNNLIGGHKRTQALDMINKYDGTLNTDYDIKVEKIELSEKEEKAQNIWLNNKNVQGENDVFLMAALVEEIGIENTGMEIADVQILEAVVPNFKGSSNEEIVNDIKNVEDNYETKKQAIKNLKKNIKDSIKDTQRPSYFTITFKEYTEKAKFLEGIGINGDDLYINGNEFIKKIYE